MTKTAKKNNPEPAFEESHNQGGEDSSLCSKRDLSNIDIYRGFIEKFSLLGQQGITYKDV